jgi:hypothetical protein
MNPEQAVDLIEKLIDQKISLDSLAKSKTVAGDKRQFLLEATKQNVSKTKTSLLDALKSSRS